MTLVIIFSVIFWLLYSLATFWHKSRKMNQEIEAIRVQNEQNMNTIEEKKQRLAYLQTPQRIEKEAKMQIGRKQPGEKVLVFIEETLDIIPTETEKRQKEHIERTDVPIFDKWKWIFWGQR